MTATATILEKIFDEKLPEPKWKMVTEGVYNSPREKLRARIVNRALKKGVTPEQFQKQLEREVGELENVSNKKLVKK